MALGRSPARERPPKRHASENPRHPPTEAEEVSGCLAGVSTGSERARRQRLCAGRSAEAASTPRAPTTTEVVACRHHREGDRVARPKPNHRSRLQGFAPPSSTYHAPPLPAVHMAYPSMGFVPLRGLERTARRHPVGQQPRLGETACPQWTHRSGHPRAAHPSGSSRAVAEAPSRAPEVCPISRLTPLRPKPGPRGPPWGF
jgi:hypothetical protein